MTKLTYTLLLSFITLCTTAFAQVKPSEIIGSWVIHDLRFKDGAALPDENPLKYTFVKYTFDESNVMYSTTKAQNRGALTYYQIKKDQLIINNASGVILNNFLISKRGSDTLMILRKGSKGFADPDGLMYTFVRENLFQQARLKISSNDFTVSGRDTVYNQSSSLYAKFYLPAGFETYAIDELKDKVGEQGTAIFRMSFIVDKNGAADSIRVIKGIWQAYDEMYLKTFKKVKNKWKPALLNGKPVAVRMFAEARYVASAMIQPSNVYTSQGDQFYNNGRFDTAIQYYDAALKNYPDNENTMYKRGICKIRLNDIPGALADFKAVKEMRGNLQIDALIAKYSNSSN
ncbi:MAG TPA: tetratricopeptide repeat protein [Pedobacter sp.]|jgi:tetratricopeptide (TPR) repeat protein